MPMSHCSSNERSEQYNKEKQPLKAIKASKYEHTEVFLNPNSLIQLQSFLQKTFNILHYTKHNLQKNKAMKRFVFKSMLQMCCLNKVVSVSVTVTALHYSGFGIMKDTNTAATKKREVFDYIWLTLKEKLIQPDLKHPSESIYFQDVRETRGTP